LPLYLKAQGREDWRMFLPYFAEFSEDAYLEQSA